MSSFTISLDEKLTRKGEILRDEKYPTSTFEQAMKQFLRDTLDAAVPDSRITKTTEEKL
jgi:hypothetical protein